MLMMPSAKEMMLLHQCLLCRGILPKTGGSRYTAKIVDQLLIMRQSGVQAVESSISVLS